MSVTKWTLALAIAAACGASTVQSPTRVPPPPMPDARALLAQGIKAWPHRLKIFESFARDCDRSVLSACQMLVGSAVVAEERRAWYERAGTALLRACAGGDVLSCRYTATRFEAQLDARSLDQQCARGVADACATAAARHSPPDASLLGRACKLGRSESCELLVHADASWENDRQQAHVKGCDAGYVHDCWAVVDGAALHSEQRAKLEAHANDIAYHGCLDGNAEYCSSWEGDDDREALAVNRMFCVLDPDACHRFAELAQATGGRAIVESRLAFESSCLSTSKLPNPDRATDCEKAAALYAQDLGDGPADAKRAAELAQQACKLGDAASCATK